MDQNLQNIITLVEECEALTAEQKRCIAEWVKELDKSITITEFKLERTEKVKRTTAILLEETIAELEQKRAAVEAQNRELEIEAALERVRSRTMAMHHSNELAETATVLFQQLKELGAQPERFIIAIVNEEERVFEFWSTEQGGNEISHKFKVSIDEPVLLSRAYKAWQEKKKSVVIELTGENLNQFIKYLHEEVHLPIKEELLKKRRAHTLAFFTQGFLNITSHEPLPPEIIKLTERFAKVFEQTYTRFLDLQKAEAQAREAQIEAALERVRSRSLAMHKAEELGEVITVIFEKLKELNFSVADGVALITFIEGSRDLNEWMVNPGFPSAIRFHLPYFDHPVMTNLWNAKEQGADFFVGQYSAEENRSFLKHIFEYSDYKHTPQDIKDFCLAADSYANSIAFQKNTAIFINDYTGHPLSPIEIDILK
ncbi:MAG: hypothetical protein ICV65_12010, partial [Flavisolibacter sp.]|nr:hypothetical protein [Flavisolibacter sp.]